MFEDEEYTKQLRSKYPELGLLDESKLLSNLDDAESLED